MCRRVAIGCGVLALLAVAGLALLFFNITRRPARHGVARTTPLSAPPTAEEQRSAEAVAQRLQDQFCGAPAELPETPPASGSSSHRRRRQRAPVNTDPRPFTVRLTDADVSALLNGSPDMRKALANGKVEDLQVRFEPDQIVVEAMLPVMGDFAAHLTATGRIWAQDGKLEYETRSVSLGSIPVPAKVRKELDHQMSKSIRQLNRGMTGYVDRVELRAGELVAQGTTAGG